MIRTLAIVIAAAFGVLAACELVLQLLPVSTATLTGYRIHPSILNYPPRHHWTMSTGWDLRNAQHLVSNNLGFSAQRDFVPDERAVPLIGDSFVEASMLDAADRPASQLERALAGRPVYEMGGPGSSLLDYAERIRWAASRLGTRDMVVLMERADVRQSICGSGNIHAACLDATTFAPRMETLPEAGMAKRLLRRSALAQYVFSQLKLDPAGLWRKAIEQSRPTVVMPTGSAAAPSTAPQPAALAAPHDVRTVDAVTDRFFDRIDGQPTGRLVIVIDSDRTRLRQHLPIDDPLRRRFIERARARGAVVVDTEPVFAAHFAHSTLRLEVSPSDTHLNPLALRLAMQAAADALRGPAR